MKQITFLGSRMVWRESIHGRYFLYQKNSARQYKLIGVTPSELEASEFISGRFALIRTYNAETRQLEGLRVL